MNAYQEMTDDELTFCDDCGGNLEECDCADQPDYEILYCRCGGIVYHRRYLEPRCTRCGQQPAM